MVDGLAEELKLSKEEFAFYTALEVNDSAVKVLGDETLKTIAGNRRKSPHQRHPLTGPSKKAPAQSSWSSFRVL